MTLDFAPYDASKRTPVPPPAPNGGWYTGESCGAKPWCTVHTVPDAQLLNSQTLLSANPPPGVTKQPATNPRGSNNFFNTEGMCDTYGLWAPLSS